MDLVKLRALAELWTIRPSKPEAEIRVHRAVGRKFWFGGRGAVIWSGQMGLIMR